MERQEILAEQGGSSDMARARLGEGLHALAAGAGAELPETACARLFPEEAAHV